ncbi:MAG: hypothetical protein ACM3PT_11660 [Deltaproteobacteria bacterium]
MKKLLIGAVVGSVLLFFLQFLSWGILNIHRNEMAYTEKQDTILQFLTQNLKEGNYFLPTVPEGTPQEEAGKAMENATGKPWAMIQYHDSMSNNMGMNMFRGWVTDLVALLVLCWLLLKFANLSFKTSVLASWAVGFIGWLTVTYTNSIWFEGCTIPAFLDVVVQWGVVGSWLGWWLTRK